MVEQEVYIRVLKQRLKDLNELIGREREQARQITESIEQKEEKAQYIRKLLESEGVLPRQRLSDKVAPASVADMAYEVIGRHLDNNPIYYRELVDLIVAEGFFIPGKDPGANLISHINRDERFVRTGRGMYGLAEWGIKPAPKRARAKRRKSAGRKS